MLNLEVADHVRYRSQEQGGVVILDMSAGEWVVLNPTAGDLWRSWQDGAEFAEAVRDVAERYPDVPVAAIKSDAEHLLSELIDRHYMQPAVRLPALAAQPPSAQPPSAAGPGPGRSVGARMAARPGSDPLAPSEWLRSLVALVFLAAADVLLRCSFRRACTLVRLSRKSWCQIDLAAGPASRTVEAVRRAARWYPGRAACLERSLAAALLAAAARRRLDWCLGSVPDPYRFHAWVAVAGQPVAAADDDPDLDQFDLVLSV